MSDINKANERDYETFKKNSLVHTSKDFYIQRYVYCTVSQHIEIRMVDGKFIPACVQVRKLKTGEVELIWFNLYRDDSLKSEMDFAPYVNKFLKSFNGAG